LGAGRGMMVGQKKKAFFEGSYNDTHISRWIHYHSDYFFNGFWGGVKGA
jgi:hypothetical protein